MAMFVHETLVLNIYRDRDKNIFNNVNQYGKYCFECSTEHYLHINIHFFWK